MNRQMIALRRRVLTLVAISSVLLAVSTAAAAPRYLTTFNIRMGTANTQLDTCGTCHVHFNDDSAGLNPFGLAFEAVPNHETTPIDALLSLQELDPDQDRIASGNEIAALFMPGWSCENFRTARNAPADLASYVDPSNPGCVPNSEIECFDGLDDDLDGLPDCADPDCEGMTNGLCSTGQPGICSAGTLACSEGAEMCLADALPMTEGTVTDFTCVDGLDNDCDALIDGADPSCQLASETVCDDGRDDDGDGLADCQDPDCQGAMLGSCDTGEPGLCAAGALSCSEGQTICVALSPAEIEAPESPGSCSDAVDNDCDGLVDGADIDCDGPVADVYTLDLRAPTTLKLRVGRFAKHRHVIVSAKGEHLPREATVTLSTDPIQAVSVAIDPASMTRALKHNGRATRYRFRVDVECNEPGTWLLEWKARFEALGELEETLSASTRVECRSERRDDDEG
jgi:hypothetical protein